MSNLYWPVYKNLEKEVIDLSYSINFDDSQFEYIKSQEGNNIKSPPYSVKIGDLLIRCCTEIEALIQELTRGKEEEVKKTPTVDSKRPITTGCRLKYLHNNWSLNKKVVIVSCLSMYFQQDENKSFYPFDYNKNGYDDYYSAYNAIKHNRSDQTIYKGNIRHLFRAIASLFLLNIYYKDEPIFLGKNSSTNSVPLNSDLFAVEAIRAAMTQNDNSVKVTLGKFKETVSAVFLIKTTQEFKEREKEGSDEFMTLVNDKIRELLKNNPNQEINELRKRALQQVGQTKLWKTLENTEYEAVTIKPEKIDFYVSQGCSKDYTKEQLDEIEEEAQLWKANIIT